MADPVKLIGLDFGTTTSSAVIAVAQLQHTATGRYQLEQQEEIYRSDMVFTPLLADDRLDLAAVEHRLDTWLEAGGVRTSELFGGGALLTGLTAQKENAAGLIRLIRRRVGDALIAAADDPCLEAWLAFMGSCADLSRQRPDTPILNLDIGGGTTNLALGQDRQVIRSGCLFLGARHVQVIPGTYHIVKQSTYARDLFAHLGIAKGPGDELAASEVDAMMGFYLSLLETTVGGALAPRVPDCTHGASTPPNLEQVHFQMPSDMRHVAVTFSGGVGELVYRHLQGAAWPPTTHFGDLGIDLARRIVQSPVWADSLRQYRPLSAGRATVYGLLRHTTEVSGSTLFLGSPSILPLADLPILGRLQANSPDGAMRDVLTLVRRSSRGGAVQVRIGSHDSAAVRAIGQRLAAILHEDAFPATHPLVLLVQENVGKVLGQYMTRWGASPLALLVIDEVAERDAQYVQIGTPREQIVPVFFYGLLS